MNEAEIYHWALLGMFAMAVLTAGALWVRTAPYGRYGEAGWGPTVNNRLGWIIMESPASLTIAVMFLLGTPAVGAWVLLAVWEVHYIHRAFLYPFKMRPGAPMPLSIAAMGAIFNVYNGYLNGRWLSHFSTAYDGTWLADPRFAAGVVLFFAGFAINLHADKVLRNLRKPGDTGYYIPQGGLYRWVSCPNYLGEMLEWFGWALATWSLPGLAFAVYTVANLGPRALAHHRWYRKKFPDYPAERRALIPLML